MSERVIITLFVASILWVVVDAKNRRIPQLGQKEFGSQDPWVWGICCLLLWIVVFPAYIIKRSVCTTRDEAHQTACIKPAIADADELLKFKQLLDGGAITQEEFNATKARILGTSPPQPARPTFIQME